MTGLEQAALIIAAIWLVVLTLVLLLVVRQMGLLTVRLTLIAPHSSADDDGPEIGSQVPKDVPELVALDGHPMTLVFFSATCAVCRTLAASLTPEFVGEDTLTLIAGDPALARPIARLLPESADHLFEPRASQVAQALSVESVPFAIRVEGGLVQSKTYLHSASDLQRLNGKRSGVRLSLRPNDPVAAA
jgi:hypothetical protein